MKTILLFVFLTVSLVFSKEWIELVSGKKVEILSVDTASLFEGYDSTITCRIVDFAGDKIETKMRKSTIASFEIYGKKISWNGTLLSTIDTNQSIFKTGQTPKQGAYRSLVEVIYNAPSAYVTPYEVKSETEILAWRETRYAAHTLDTLEVKSIQGDCASECIVAYSTGDSLFWGNTGRMYHLNLHPVFSWYEAKSVIKRSNYIESFSPTNPTGILATKNVGLRTKLFLVNMKNGEQKQLTKDLLYRLLDKYDKELAAQFDKQKKKKDHLKEYFLKLLESLDKV